MHISKKTGSVFYVGKGFGNRAYSHTSRNKHWNNIAKSHGFDVKILANFTNKICAFSIEIALIKRLGLENLTNVTKGGEGGLGSKPGKDHHFYGKLGVNHPRTGSKHSDADRKKISVGRRNGKNSVMGSDKLKELKDRMTGNKYALGYKQSISTKEKISKSMVGDKNPSYNHNNLHFSSADGKNFYGTMYDFCEEYKLNKGNVCWMIKGKNKTVKGWSYMGCADVSPE